MGTRRNHFKKETGLTRPYNHYPLLPYRNWAFSQENLSAGLAGRRHSDQPDGFAHLLYNKTCVKRSLSKRAKIGFQYQSSLNAGQKYCRMLQGEHSAILSLPFVIKSFVLSILSGRFTQALLYMFACSTIIFSMRHEKTYPEMRVVTRYDSNQHAQLQRLAIILASCALK